MFTPAESAHLYMWVTNNYLPKGLWLGEALGFAYKTIVTWPKPRAGLGQYFRGRTGYVDENSREGLRSPGCNSLADTWTLLATAHVVAAPAHRRRALMVRQ